MPAKSLDELIAAAKSRTILRKDEENFVQMDAPAVRLVAEEFIV